MRLLGPFNVGYPVVFRSGGDTTRAAFGKHIQEIEKIYGILNALDADKLSASDLDDKLGNFTPRMSFDDITGNLDMSRITGSLDGSRITGQIDASKIFGRLNNANIDAGNVNGLSALIRSLSPDKGDGITALDDNSNGYAEFNNGFLIQWGRSEAVTQYERLKEYDVSFKIPFSSHCFAVFPAGIHGGITNNGRAFVVQLEDFSLSGFSYKLYDWYTDFHSPYLNGSFYVAYLAVGI